MNLENGMGPLHFEKEESEVKQPSDASSNKRNMIKSPRNYEGNAFNTNTNNNINQNNTTANNVYITQQIIEETTTQSNSTLHQNSSFVGRSKINNLHYIAQDILASSTHY